MRARMGNSRPRGGDQSWLGIDNGDSKRKLNSREKNPWRYGIGIGKMKKKKQL